MIRLHSMVIKPQTDATIETIETTANIEGCSAANETMHLSLCAGILQVAGTEDTTSALVVNLTLPAVCAAITTRFIPQQLMAKA